MCGGNDFSFFIFENLAAVVVFSLFFAISSRQLARHIYFLDGPRRTNLRRLKSARGLPQDSSGQLGAKTQTHTGTHTDIGTHKLLYLRA